MSELRRVVISVGRGEHGWGGTAEMSKGVPLTARATATAPSLAETLDRLVAAVLDEVEWEGEDP